LPDRPPLCHLVRVDQTDPVPPSWVLHVDLDQFVAAVEVLRRPELAGLPVVVGGRGDPSERGVVSTASYEARAFGVGSGMPLRLAARKCPDAVFVPVDAPAYETASLAVMAVLRTLTPVVEVLGWDEAFLAVETADPEAFGRDVQAQILARCQLHSSVGVGDNRLRAKIATGYAKPAGIFRLTEDNWFEVMADRAPDALWGIGRKTAKRLAAHGLHTVRQLADADPTWLAEQLGPVMGPWYRRLARGVDRTLVTSDPYIARSHGRETTFQANITARSEVEEHVRRLARRVAHDVHGDGRPVIRVWLKVRYAPFQTHTYSVALKPPTDEASVIERAAVGLLTKVDAARAVRLLGVRAELAAPGPDSEDRVQVSS